MAGEWVNKTSGFKGNFVCTKVNPYPKNYSVEDPFQILQMLSRAKLPVEMDQLIELRERLEKEGKKVSTAIEEAKKKQTGSSQCVICMDKTSTRVKFPPLFKVTLLIFSVWFPVGMFVLVKAALLH
jgi:hypothetical protein